MFLCLRKINNTKKLYKLKRYFSFLNEILESIVGLNSFFKKNTHQIVAQGAYSNNFFLYDNSFHVKKINKNYNKIFLNPIFLSIDT
jgi:hypothetical protein